MQQMISRAKARLRNAGDDTGTTLVEVAVSMTILAILAAGLFSMAALALTRSENQGHLAARTAEYAQDKMEQLLVLAYTNQISDTVVFPAAISGGSGLTIGGGLNTAAPIRRPPAAPSCRRPAPGGASRPAGRSGSRPSPS